MFQAVIDGGQGIFDRKDETGGELLQASPGIHQCGRIGKKIEAGHAIVPALGRVGQPAGGGIESFSLCDVVATRQNSCGGVSTIVPAVFLAR